MRWGNRGGRESLGAARPAGTAERAAARVAAAAVAEAATPSLHSTPANERAAAGAASDS